MRVVLIVGGGIGGLAAALSLAANGFRAVVLERNSEFTELGAGIQLAPNAFHALDLLGVGAEVRERAVYIDELRLMDGTTGEPVVRMPLTEDYRTRFGNPYAVVHRGDLYQPLLDACRDNDAITLHSDCPVTGYEQDGGTVTVHQAGGHRWHGDILIGADGIRSTIRRTLLDDGDPRVCGHTIYRSVIPMDQVPESLRSNAVTLWAGPGWHFVHYPIAEGGYLNLAAIRDDGARRVVTGDPVDTQLVRDAFPGLPEIPRRILRLGADWRTWVLCDRSPVDTWTDGRVALLGDAAHPMLQYAAQGAGMALEDAVVLGEMLDPCDVDYPAALRAYNAIRRARAARTQLTSRAMGVLLYHPSGEAALARNATLGAASPAELYDKVAWLHGVRDFVKPETPGRINRADRPAR